MSWRKACVRLPAAVAASALLMTQSCTGEDRPEPVDSSSSSSVSLLALAPSEIKIPPHSRPGGEAPPTDIPLTGPWRDDGTTSKGMHKFTMDVPIRPRGLFFHRPQPGITLSGPAGQLPYKRYVKSGTPYWWHNADELFVLFPKDRGAPRSDAVIRPPRCPVCVFDV